MAKKLIAPIKAIAPGRASRVRNVFFVGIRDDWERVQLALGGKKSITLHWLDSNTCNELKTELTERLGQFAGRAQDGLMVTSGTFYENPTAEVARKVAPRSSYVHVTSNIEDCSAAVYNPLMQHSLHYTGDLDVYLTAVRLVEAHANFGRDNKPITLVVEDQPNYYTPFLKTLEKFNRGRTWVLLARTYDEAQKIVDDYGSRLCVVISDWQYRHKGVRDENAGETLIKHMKEKRLRVPVIFNSSEAELVQEKAAAYGAVSFWKNHPDPLGELSRIMNEYVFGGFIFRTPHGKAVTEPIRDAKTLAAVLRQMTPEIVLYHSGKNDFSRWLQLQGYNKTAKEIRPWQGQDGRLLKNKIAERLENEISEKEITETKNRK